MLLGITKHFQVKYIRKLTNTQEPHRKFESGWGAARLARVGGKGFFPLLKLTISQKYRGHGHPSPPPVAWALILKSEFAQKMNWE